MDEKKGMNIAVNPLEEKVRSELTCAEVTPPLAAPKLSADIHLNAGSEAPGEGAGDAGGAAPDDGASPEDGSSGSSPEAAPEEVSMVCVLVAAVTL